jgi:hypothetical protein
MGTGLLKCGRHGSCISVGVSRSWTTMGPGIALPARLLVVSALQGRLQRRSKLVEYLSPQSIPANHHCARPLDLPQSRRFRHGLLRSGMPLEIALEMGERCELGL